jgi:hypothetical protein
MKLLHINKFKNIETYCIYPDLEHIETIGYLSQWCGGGFQLPEDSPPPP